MNYYYTDETGDVLGPVSLEALQKLSDAGLAPPSSQVCVEGSEIWNLISTVISVTRKTETKSTASKINNIPIAPIIPPTGPARSSARVLQELSNPGTTPRRNESKQITPWVLSLALISAGFIGNVHFITGSDIQGFQLVRKGSFGFTETFINVDMITGMPWIAAKTRFPIGCRVLQRERIIESEAGLQVRTQREVRQKFEESQQEVRRLMKRYE